MKSSCQDKAIHYFLLVFQYKICQYFHCFFSSHVKITGIQKMNNAWPLYLYICAILFCSCDAYLTNQCCVFPQFYTKNQRTCKFNFSYVKCDNLLIQIVYLISTTLKRMLKAEVLSIKSFPTKLQRHLFSVSLLVCFL